MRKVIVSGSGREEIKIITENIQLDRHFEYFLSVDDYKHGKPDPAGFIMALNYLNLAYDEVLAFEDARSGIEAAKKIGIPTVFIKEFAKDDYSSMADFSYETFKAFYDQFVQF